MDNALFWLAVVNLVICLAVGRELLVAARSIRRLSSIPPLEGDDLPRLSIVVAARNEARHLEPALRSLLALDYPRLEIVAVNDRSTDDTGPQLDRLAAEARARGGEGTPLLVVHVRELPAGWLGKNHALFRGAGEARGEYLLFTDADVVMERTVLRRAMAHVRQHELDHLALLFRLAMPSWLLEAFVVTFSVYFIAHFRPWKVRDPHSRAHIGVGGFNLLRAEAYKQLGTHRAIAMRPDDDLKLGKLVKKHGLRQDVLLAPDLVEVRWYSSLRELVVGLEKNAFAGVDYRIPVVVISSLAILLLNAFPFVAVFLTSGATRGLFAAVAGCLLLMAAHTARQGGLRTSTALGFPLAVVLFAFIQWRTMVLNLWQGGIRWRDTFYPLTDLRANKV